MPELSENETHQLNKGLKFESFLIAFGESASRARKIINVLIIASIAVLLGLLNSLKKEWNWFPSRQEKMREMYHVVKFNEDNVIDSITIRTGNTFKRVENKFEGAVFRQMLLELSKGTIAKKELDTPVTPWTRFKFPAFVQKETIIDTSLIISNKEFIISGYNMACQTSIASKNELEMILRAMARARLENSTFVRVPILGIAFDVNWLIIASGVGFVAMYFLLYYSLSRERKNIRLLFQIGIYEKISVARLYQFMSMQQVFTIPQSIDEYFEPSENARDKKETWTNKIRRVIPKIFWCSPLIFWICIFFYDIATIRFGEAVNHDLTWTQFRTSICLGLIILLLTTLCILESVKIDREWHYWSQYIRQKEQENAVFSDPSI